MVEAAGKETRTQIKDRVLAFCEKQIAERDNLKLMYESKKEGLQDVKGWGGYSDDGKFFSV